MSRNKNLIKQYETDYNGQKVTVKVLKPKQNKVINSTRSNFVNCPNCTSKMALDNAGLQCCSGDKLALWDKQFSDFSQLDESKKSEFLKNISYDSVFIELYDRWTYAKSNPEETFNCGYTNKIFLPIPSSSVIIPDPSQVKRIEGKLGRKLSEDEIFGEKELFMLKGNVFDEYRDGAKSVKISLLRFPEDCY